MSYRFLLFDLDGTLLDSERNIRPASLAVLARLMRRGIGVGLATGRMPRSARRYVEVLRPTGPCVCFNGAVVWDFERERALASHRLSRDVALDALRIGRAHRVHANLYFDDDIYIETVTAVSEESAQKDGVRQLAVGPLAEWLGGRDEVPVKILFIGEPSSLVEVAREIRARHREASLVRSEPDYLEVLPHGVDKSVGMRALCAAARVTPGEVIAFGDNLNDVEMVRAAGVGVALGNAHEELKAVADVVIGENDSDAIAAFLRERFPELVDAE